MKKIYLLFLLLFAATVSFAQHTVSGIISDKTDKTKLLEGVSVYIPEFNRFDISKDGGTYILRNVGVGTVSVQFTRIGYKSLIKTISTKDSATVLSVEMEPSMIELEDVTITSNSSKLPDNIPYSISDYNVAEMRRSGNVNLMQALNYKPGIDMISLGNGINKPVVRGLSFNRLLVYSNGTRIENQAWDDRHDIGVSDNGVENIEVVKGPAALIYGADAMGGALVFTDEKPAVAGTTKGDVNLGFYTNTLGLNLDAGIKSTSEKGIFYSLRFGAQSHTSYIQGEGEEVVKNTEERDFAANSKFMSMNGKATVGMSKKWGVSKLTYSYLNQQIGIIEIEDPTQVSNEADGEQRDREMEAPYQDVTTHLISSENTIVSGKGKINLNLAYQLNDRKEFEPLPDKQKEQAIGLKSNSFTYDLKYSSDAQKKFGYTIGSQGYLMESKNNGLEGLVPDAKTNDFGAYALVRYDLPKWNFLAGVRFDARTMEVESYENAAEADTLEVKPEVEIDKEYSLLNGSLGAAFHPIDGLTLKANASTGFTAPNYAQLGTWGKHEGAYRFEKGNQLLNVEKNFEGDFGVIWEMKGVSVQFDAFYNNIMDYIYIRNTGQDTILVSDSLPNDTVFIYQYAQADAHILGAELSIDIHPQAVKWLDLNLSYAMTKGEFAKGGFIPYIPADKLTAALTIQGEKMNYIKKPYLSIVGRSYFMQEDIAEFETATESYFLLDLHLGGSFGWGQQTFDLTVSVNNLLNTGYFNHLSLIKDLKPKGIREMGRNIAINLRVPFGFKKK